MSEVTAAPMRDARGVEDKRLLADRQQLRQIERRYGA
jgi:hypothetical protein